MVVGRGRCTANLSIDLSLRNLAEPSELDDGVGSGSLGPSKDNYESCNLRPLLD